MKSPTKLLTDSKTQALSESQSKSTQWLWTPLSSVEHLISTIYMAFLFTKSDIKTTLIPVTFFAIAAAPISNIAQVPHVMAWIWIHLLQFDVSNQTMDPDEDTFNKSDRPLPSKRITLKNAIILRWILVPVCFAISRAYSLEVLYASMALVFLTVLYNELAAHAGNFVVRNVVNGAGFMAFELGSTLIAGPDRGKMNAIAVLAVAISGGIFATTIHAQDFKDEEGDRKIGRQTIPIVFPSIARFTVLGPLMAWSAVLLHIWELDLACASVFCALAFFVGLYFWNAQTVNDKQIAFYWYNVWLSFAHALPGYYYMYRTHA